MRILLLANSYPTQAAPSGAAYMTARLAALHRRDADVRATALALRPTYTRPARALRRLTGAATDSSLALAARSDGWGPHAWWEEAPARWGVRDLVSSRRQRRPEAALGRAVDSVQSTVQRLGSPRFDVIHAHGMYTLPAGEVGARLAARWGVPLVVTMHGSDVEQAMAAQPALARATLEQAAATVYVSRALAERAWDLGMPRDNAHVIPNGVDTSRFTPRPGDASGAGTVTQGPHLLYVGNLAHVKGADRLPGIVHAVAETHPGVHLTVAGDGPFFDQVHDELADRVTMLGRVPQERVAELMRAADLLLVPSRAEGWGCVVTESYASGTPVVATGVGGLHESALPGALVPGGSAEPEFVQRFAACVLETLASPPAASEMTEHVAGFSWDEIVARELAVLKEAIG